MCIEFKEIFRKKNVQWILDSFSGFDCNCNASNTNIYKFNTDWEKNMILEKAKFVD